MADSASYDHFPSADQQRAWRASRRSRPLEGDERLALDAMLRARFTRVDLGDAVEGVGMHARDLAFAQGFFLADVALSQTSDSSLVLATRLLTFEAFSMTTGVHVVCDEAFAPVTRGPWTTLAGRARDVTPRESSLAARRFLRLGRPRGGAHHARRLRGLAAPARRPAPRRLPPAARLAAATRVALAARSVAEP